MSSPSHHVTYSFDEYVALEDVSNIKHDFLAGHIYAMAGGTPEHAALAASVIGHLFPQLQNGRCRIYDSDLRVRVRATGLATYPDVTVVCGPREHDPADRNTVVNPMVIVEVLSRHTEEYDRGEKADHYRQIASLREYVLVAYTGRRIEVWHRNEDGSWTHTEACSGGTASLPSVACALDVDGVYDAAADPS